MWAVPAAHLLKSAAEFSDFSAEFSKSAAEFSGSAAESLAGVGNFAGLAALLPRCGGLAGRHCRWPCRAGGTVGRECRHTENPSWGENPAEQRANLCFFTEKTCKVCRFQPFAVPLSFDLPCHSVRWPTMVGQPLAWQGRYRTHFVFFRERCLSLPTLTFHFPIV